MRTLGLDASVVYLGYDGMRQTIAEMYQERKGGIYYWCVPGALSRIDVLLPTQFSLSS